MHADWEKWKKNARKTMKIDDASDMIIDEFHGSL